MLKSFSIWLFKITHKQEIERIKRTSKTLLIRAKDKTTMSIPLEHSQKVSSDSLLASLSTLHLL